MDMCYGTNKGNFSSIDNGDSYKYFWTNIFAMKRLIALVLVAVLMYGCKKSGNAKQSSSTSDTTTFKPDPPAITPVGTPIGTIVTKTIGSAGGSLTSADGRVILTIPANALAANTDISVQPVTNNAPGGIGAGYHLMPDGTTFATPATLTFHYADSEVLGSQPYLLYIAFQDSTNAWQADFANRNIDTVAKTATEEISHFSLWSLGDRLSLSSIPVQLKHNETSSADIVYVKVPPKLVKDANGDYELSTLPITVPVPDDDIGNWAVDGVAGGSAQDGTIVGPGSSATYTAPASIDKRRSVQISAEVELIFDVYNNKQPVNTLQKFILSDDIGLIPDTLSFKVEVDLTVTNTSALYNDVYKDAVTMRVDVFSDEDSVLVSGFINQAPTDTPPTGTVGTQTAEWVPDKIGWTNVVSASGWTAPLGPNTSINVVILYFTHSGAVTPTWIISDNADGTAYTTGGDPSGGLPVSVEFKVVDDPQVLDLYGDGTVVIKSSLIN
jgi:hypothetical protein